MPLNNQGYQGNADGDIPLTKVTTSSSSTGARKPNQALPDDMAGEDMSEKKGFFRSRSNKGPAGRRKVHKDLKEKGRQGSWGSNDMSLNAMGRLYNKIIGFSVITRYLVYVVPVAILLAIPLVLLPVTGHKDDIHVGGQLKNSDGTPATDANDKPIMGPSLFYLFLWIEISWLSVWAAKIVAHLLPGVFMFFCGVVSSGTRKYATVLKNLEIPLSLFIWALISWLVFKNFFKNTSFEWISVITNILGALFASSAVFLGEKFIVQLISITYHQRSFANRIKDSKHEVFLLGLLYDASRTLFPMYCDEFSEEDYIINDSIEMMLAGKRGHKKSGSVTPMRLIGNAARIGDKVTSVFGNIASEITGKQVFNPNSAHSIVVEALEKVRTSEALARRIWMSFVVEGKDSLSCDDVIEVLGPAHKLEAEECFEAIDSDQNGDISLDEMIRKVVEIGKERKAIAHSMKDIGQALQVFDSVLLFLVLLIVVFIFLAFFQSSFITTLATAGTALLSLSFVFAVTTQEFLGSCIFLFVKHPYDVGDRVDIVGPEKEQLIVERISLLYTVFTRIDKMQVVQVPNIILNNLWIENVSRSKAMKEVIDVNVSYDTSFEDIELLRLEMEKFVRNSDNSRDFMPDIAISVGSVNDLDKMTLKIAIKHKSNWHNEGVRASRRSKFMCALALALKKIPINGPGGGGEPLGGPTNPSYSVTVSDAIAAAARDKADRDKDAARMVPSKPTQDASGSPTKTEQQAVTELNMRDAASTVADQYGYNRDDDTLNEREESLDRKRSNDIETVRQELLAKTQSQRGRRKPGEGLPPMPLGDNMPGVSVSQYNSPQYNPRVRSFDVESQSGIAPQPQTFAGVPLGNPASGSSQQNYSVFPPPSRTYSPPGSSSNNLAAIQAAAPHPLQSAPTPSTTSRSRGQSISRTQPGQQGYSTTRQYPGT